MPASGENPDASLRLTDNPTIKKIIKAGHEVSWPAITDSVPSRPQAYIIHLTDTARAALSLFAEFGTLLKQREEFIIESKSNPNFIPGSGQNFVMPEAWQEAAYEIYYAQPFDENNMTLDCDAIRACIEQSISDDFGGTGEQKDKKPTGEPQPKTRPGPPPPGPNGPGEPGPGQPGGPPISEPPSGGENGEVNPPQGEEIFHDYYNNSNSVVPLPNIQSRKNIRPQIIAAIKKWQSGTGLNEFKYNRQFQNALVGFAGIELHSVKYTPGPDLPVGVATIHPFLDTRRDDFGFGIGGSEVPNEYRQSWPVPAMSTANYEFLDVGVEIDFHNFDWPLIPVTAEDCEPINLSYNLYAPFRLQAADNPLELLVSEKGYEVRMFKGTYRPLRTYETSLPYTFDFLADTAFTSGYRQVQVDQFLAGRGQGIGNYNANFTQPGPLKRRDLFPPENTKKKLSDLRLSFEVYNDNGVVAGSLTIEVRDPVYSGSRTLATYSYGPVPVLSTIQRVNVAMTVTSSDGDETLSDCRELEIWAYGNFFGLKIANITLTI